MEILSFFVFKKICEKVVGGLISMEDIKENVLENLLTFSFRK